MLNCFSDSQAIVYKEFGHQDKLSIKILIGKSLKDSGKGYNVCDQALHALECCTTTTPLQTRPSPSTKFWQKKAFLWLLSPPIRQISIPVASFHSPDSNHSKERHFGNLNNIQKSVTDELKGIPAEAFQHCYEQPKTTSPSLRSCPRELF